MGDMAISERPLKNGKTAYDIEVRTERRGASGRRLNLCRTVYNKQEAIKLEARLKVAAERGAAPDPKMTVGDLLDSWVAMHSVGDNAWSTTTLYGYLGIIDRNLKPAFGLKKLDKLTGKHLDDLYTLMKERGCSSGTVANTHAVIRAALNQAMKWQLIVINVSDHATPGPVFHQEGVVATDTEVDALLAAIARIESGGSDQNRGCVVGDCNESHFGRGFCAAHWHQWRYKGQHKNLALPTRLGGQPRGLRADGIQKLKVGLLIASETGVRRGELAGLDWARDFDWRNNTMTVRRAKADAGGKVTDQQTKTHAVRTIKLAADVVAVLKPLRGIGSVCGMSPRQLSDWWDYLCEEAGIEPLADAGDGRVRRQKKIGWHSLRHRLLNDLGGLTDIKTVADIAGHSTTRVTEKYMHTNAERAEAAMEALARKRAEGR